MTAMNTNDQDAHLDLDHWLKENVSKFLVFARQCTRSEQDAEDVLQEALVESWKLSNGKPDISLVFSKIRQRSIDLGRRMNTRSILEDKYASEADTIWFETELESSEKMDILKDSLKNLPEEQRLILTLKIWGEQTFAEIASTLKIPQGTVASRYRLALATLQKTINK